MRLANREDYEDRWTNTGPVASYDRETWSGSGDFRWHGFFV